MVRAGYGSTFFEDGWLVGIKRISAYMELSHTTIKKLIIEAGFPARRMGHYWIASKADILIWADGRQAMLERML
jgi:hypothetical protein